MPVELSREEVAQIPHFVNAPRLWVLVVSACIAGLTVAIVIVGFDLTASRMSAVWTMALGVLVCAAVIAGIQALLGEWSLKEQPGTYAVYDPPARGHENRLSSTDSSAW